MKQQYIEHLRSENLGFSTEDLNGLISENLLSPFEIQLSNDVLEQAKQFVHSCFSLRESASYQQFLAPEIVQRGLKDPANKSILMSYDFHLDSAGALKLIEINTNAGFLAMGYEMYRSRKIPLPVADFSMEEIRENIFSELRFQDKEISVPRVVIIDQEPRSQRLYGEFLIFQHYFCKWGWQAEIKDYRESLEDFDFIYNRQTDFYFEEPGSQDLRQNFLSRKVCVSPNPFEYLCLADKQRMIDWCNDEFWSQMGAAQSFKAVIQKNLPITKDVTAATAEEIWSLRKKLFLKPKRAFGSKQSYKGASISRRAFEELLAQDFVAQEYVQAPEQKFMTPMGEQSFKYDLRFYVYQNRVQMAIARVYQGQVTNLRTPFGGFAPVRFG